jgi:hypothetical protein
MHKTNCWRKTQTKTTQKKLKREATFQESRCRQKMPFSTQTPKASNHHQHHQAWQNNRFVAITHSPTQKTTQARDDHASPTKKPHSRKKRPKHQRLTANKTERRVSNRKRQKLIDLASKNLTVKKLDHDLRRQHAMDDHSPLAPSPMNSPATAN